MNKKTDKECEFEEAYTQSYSQLGTWQQHAKDDIRAYLGDSYTSKEKQHLILQGRDPLNIQLIRRIIKWVSGYQRDKRKAAKFDPVEGSDERAANDFTAIERWSMMRHGGYNTISDGFEHALKTGLCLVNQYNDEMFDTRLENFYYNQFLLDPSFTRLDLNDCHYGIMRKFVTKDQAKLLLPDNLTSKIDKMDDDRLDRDGLFPNYRSKTLYGKYLLPYDEFQQRTTVRKKFIVIKPIGKEIPWEGSQRELNQVIPVILEQTGFTSDQITVISRNMPTVEVTTFLGGQEMTNGIDPFGVGDFTFTPIIAYYDPEYDEMWLKLQGLVRCLVDTQRAENRRVSSMLAWFEASVQGGLDYEQGALVDDEDAFRSGQGKSRMFTDGAISGGKFRDRVVPDMPQGYVQIHQILNDMMPKMVNLNEEAFGQPTSNSQISTVVQQMRVEGSLIGQKGLFDNLSYSQKVMAEKRLKLYQQYPIEKVRRILNRDPAPEFSSKKFGIYDAVMQESLMTTSQKNAFYSEMLYLKEKGQSMGDPAPISWDLILKNAPIEMKNELFEDIEQKQQQAKQQAAQQQQVAQQIQQLNIRAAEAKIIEDQTQAVERRTAARENMANARLDQAKTVNEMQENTVDKALDREIKMQELQIERDKVALEAAKLQLETLTERTE